MEWQDEGTILSTRRFGEHDAIVSLMTFEHGRHVGLVRGGAGRRQRAELQLGTHVSCLWRARLADHLGTFKLEVIAALRARVIDDPLRLAAVEAICALVDDCLGERDAHPELCAAVVSLIRRVGDHDDWLADVPRFEIMLLT
ncbi:MAG: DNA repair protein RecO, partial [Pseudomonadota bacterium]